MLPKARELLLDTIACLRGEIAAGIPLVGLEPSCVAVFRDELPNLLDGDEHAKRLSQQTYTLAELLSDRAPGWTPPSLERRALVQPHCHHESVMGFSKDQSLLQGLGLDLEVLDAGCCGMAGSFGFEADKYEVSMACAERALLPAVRSAAPDALILADGFSCRTQIEQGAGRQAIHLAEALEQALIEEERRRAQVSTLRRDQRVRAPARRG
jgi:Fe-S oxidoreductase